MSSDPLGESRGPEPGGYRYGGAAVLVELHEKALREFLEVYRRFDSSGVKLPETGDPNYASNETLLAHVLGCAARYLRWVCQQAGVDPPTLEERPSPEGFSSRADSYLEEVVVAWRGPLKGLTEEQACGEVYPSRWETPYCLDAMLEHAVLHPIRHAHQLGRLLDRE